MIGLGLFFAMPFVLSIGSVVFLPITAALVLTIILSPLADKLAAWGLPNVLASFIALLIFLGALLLALLPLLATGVLPSNLTQVRLAEAMPFIRFHRVDGIVRARGRSEPCPPIGCR